jgi:hypothetical protein
MRDRKFYNEFAAQWIQAWNSHDLTRVLSYCDESIEFSSRLLAKLLPDSEGKLKGKDALAAYWSKALAARPELHFELITIFTGVDSTTLYYRDHNGKLCAEFFVFGDHGNVIEGHAHRE